MLNQIVAADAVCFNVADQLAHNVHLVISGEYEFISLQTNELLDDVHHTVCLENILPQVISGITVRIGGVALAAIVTCAVAPWLNGRKYVCSPANFVVIHA